MRLAPIVAVIGLACVVPAHAQNGDQPASNKKSAEPAKSASSGPDSTTENFGDWSIVCTTQAGSAEQVCEVNTSVLLRGQSAPFARLAIVRAARDKPARLIALVPVNVLVGSPVKIGGDAGKLDVSLPLKSCVPAGCLAEAELSKEQTQFLAAPAKAPGALSVVDAAGKSATLQFSLRGLDQALDAYFKRQEK